KLAVIPPAGTTTTGLEAASPVFELASATAVPPAGAALPSVTVPVAPPPLPPTIVDGLSVSEVTPGPTAARAGPLPHQRTNRDAATKNPRCRMALSSKPVLTSRVARGRQVVNPPCSRRECLGVSGARDGPQRRFPSPATVRWQ